MRPLPALVLLASALVACGGSSNKPAESAEGIGASEPAPAGTGSSATPGASSEAAAGGDAAPASQQDDPPAASPAPAPAAAAPAAPEVTDECTPVGVDFEKRARPKLKECYREGKKKDPDLQGTVRITVAIDYKGKIKNIKIIEKTLPDPVASCMLKAVKATPFPEASKCPDKNISIPVTFPTPP